MIYESKSRYSCTAKLIFFSASFLKNKINCQKQEDKTDEMIEFEGLGFKEYKCKKHKWAAAAFSVQ